MKKQYLYLAFCISIIVMLCLGCGNNNAPVKVTATVTPNPTATSVPQVTETKKKEFIDTERGSVCVISNGDDPDPSVAEMLELDREHTKSAVLMVSDEQYIYLVYHSDKAIGGLYRIDQKTMKAEKLDSGLYSYLTLQDGVLYYFSEEYATYHYIDTEKMEGGGLSADEYFAMRAKYNLDTGNKFDFPKGVIYWVHSGDRSYILNSLSKKDVSGEFPQSGYYYSMAYVSQIDGALVNLKNRWQSEKQLKGIILPYGDRFVYTRAFQYEDKSGNLHTEYVPCFYDPEASEETVLLRNRTYNSYDGNNCYVLGVTSDYLLLSNADDEFKKDASLYLERIGSTEEGISVEGLVAQASNNTPQEKQEKQEQYEKYKDEPYGPGTSSLYLTSPSNMYAAYRLVRMDGTTEFMILMEPGQTRTMKFPSGRYTLKIAKGKTWISDDEAFGASGSYSTTNVFSFKAGTTYQIGTSTQGNVYKDNASGFTK